jgi:ribosomal protein L29
MVQMTQAMAVLKLVLAEIRAKEQQLDAQVKQFEAQMARLPRQTIYGAVPLDLALNAMSEVEERLNHARTMRRNLASIKERAQRELEALEVVQRVEEAKISLAQLRTRVSAGVLTSQQAWEQVQELEAYIAQYSKLAERAIIMPAEPDFR